MKFFQNSKNEWIRIIKEYLQIVFIFVPNKEDVIIKLKLILLQQTFLILGLGWH